MWDTENLFSYMKYAPMYVHIWNTENSTTFIDEICSSPFIHKIWKVLLFNVPLFSYMKYRKFNHFHIWYMDLYFHIWNIENSLFRDEMCIQFHVWNIESSNIMPFSATWTCSTSNMDYSTKWNQKDNDKYHMISLICGT